MGIFFTVPDAEETVRLGTKALEVSMKWVKINYFKISEKKTKTMLFHPKGKHTDNLLPAFLEGQLWNTYVSLKTRSYFFCLDVLEQLHHPYKIQFGQNSWHYVKHKCYLSFSIKIVLH